MTEHREIVGKRWWYLSAALLALALTSLVFMGEKVAREDSLASAGGLRIVSVAPSVTEMLFALGLGDSIVGATDHCDYPAQARQIERVGGLGSPNVEKLLALSPDLVIATNFEHKHVPKLLQQAGIKVLQLKIRNIQEMFDALEKIGSATGQARQAEKVLAKMRTALRAAEKLRADIPANQRRRVFVEISNDPIITAGAGSFVDELITRAGGVNVAGGLSQAYPIINPEMVIEWNPDVIIICYMSQGGQGAGALARRIGWGDIAAVREGRIICDISNDLLLRPGPRLIEGVEVLARRLYKDQARPVAPSPAGERQTR